MLFHNRVLFMKKDAFLFQKSARLWKNFIHLNPSLIDKVWTIKETSLGLTSIDDNLFISIHIGKYIPLSLSLSVYSSPCLVPNVPLMISDKKKYWVPLYSIFAIHSLTFTSTPNSSNASLFVAPSGVSPFFIPPPGKT